MPDTHTLRTTLAAAAVAAGLFAVAAPAHAGVGVRIGFGATIVAPPLVLSVGNAAPAVRYVAPYGAGCGAHGYYVAPGYAPYPVAPYVAPYPVAAPAFVAPRAALVRVWVPGPRPHWEMRRVAHARYRRW